METYERRYRALLGYLLKNGIIQFHELPLDETEPFVVGNEFFGPDVDSAVDSLTGETFD